MMSPKDILRKLTSDREFRTEVIVRNNYPDVIANLEEEGVRAVSEDAAIEEVLKMYRRGEVEKAEEILRVPWIWGVSPENFDEAARSMGIPEAKLETLSGGGGGSSGGGGGMGGGFWTTIIQYSGEAFQAGANYEATKEQKDVTTDLERGFGGGNYVIWVAAIVVVAIGILLFLYMT